MFNRRITDRLCQYWEKLKKDERLPSVHIFNSEAIKDIWQNCAEISVITETGKSIFSIDSIGRAMIEAFGQDMKGFSFNPNIKGVPGEKVMEKIAKVIETGQHVMEDGIFINKKHETVKYRVCIVPFGDGKSNRVIKVVVGMTWHEKV